MQHNTNEGKCGGFRTNFCISSKNCLLTLRICHYLRNYWYRFTANRLGKQRTKFEEGKFTQPRERAFKTWTFGKNYEFVMRVFPDTSSFNALLSVLAFKIHLDYL